MSDLSLLPENPVAVLTDEEFNAAFERGRRDMLAWIEENIPPLEFPEQDDEE